MINEINKTVVNIFLFFVSYDSNKNKKIIKIKMLFIKQCFNSNYAHITLI